MKATIRVPSASAQMSSCVGSVHENRSDDVCRRRLVGRRDCTRRCLSPSLGIAARTAIHLGRRRLRVRVVARGRGDSAVIRPTSATCRTARTHTGRIARRAIGWDRGATAATRRTTGDCRAAITDRAGRSGAPLKSRREIISRQRRAALTQSTQTKSETAHGREGGRAAKQEMSHEA